MLHPRARVSGGLLSSSTTSPRDSGTRLDIKFMTTPWRLMPWTRAKGKGRSEARARAPFDEKGQGKGTQPMEKGKGNMVVALRKTWTRTSGLLVSSRCASSSCGNCCALCSVRCSNVHCPGSVTDCNRNRPHHISELHRSRRCLKHLELCTGR